MFCYSQEGRAVDNTEAAQFLFGLAGLLEAQGANPYRVQAYRRAAVGLLRLPEPAERYLDAQGQLVLPWLGPRLRRKLGELVTHGCMQFHDDLLAELPRPLGELLKVPGIGPKTANRLIQQLGIRSVRGVVRAARRHQLQTLPGIGSVRERQLGSAAETVLAQVA